MHFIFIGWDGRCESRGATIGAFKYEEEEPNVETVHFFPWEKKWTNFKKDSQYHLI